jgi:hypothetical protein
MKALFDDWSQKGSNNNCCFAKKHVFEILFTNTSDYINGLNDTIGADSHDIATTGYNPLLDVG